MTKTCSQCHSEKPLSDFYAHPGGRFGVMGKCKVCVRLNVASNFERVMADPARAEIERDRQREKQRKRRADGKVKRPPKSYCTAAAKRNREKQAQKHRARIVTQNALKDGSLLRLPCEVCGSRRSEAHHPDHEKPLEVQWLCKTHHAEADNAIRKQQRLSKV